MYNGDTVSKHCLWERHSLLWSLLQSGQIFPKAQDSQCFIQSNHPDFLLLIINTIFIKEQNSGASSRCFHPTGNPGALGLEILPGSSSLGQLLLRRILCWLWQGSGGQSPAPCTGCHVHVNVLMVVLTSIPTSRCSKRGFFKDFLP